MSIEMNSVRQSIVFSNSADLTDQPVKLFEFKSDKPRAYLRLLNVAQSVYFNRKMYNSNGWC